VAKAFKTLGLWRFSLGIKFRVEDLYL